MPYLPHNSKLHALTLRNPKQILIMDEPPLPPPPRIRHRSPTGNPQSQSQSQSRAANPRVRATQNKHKSSYRRLSRFDDLSSQPSSDPALFSSDDIPASGLENYHATVSGSGSRKRRYRGTWWGEMVKDKDVKRKRADFKDKRLVDSGVWMGSDDRDSLAGSMSGFGSAPESGFLGSEDVGPSWGEDLIPDHERDQSRTQEHREQEQHQDEAMSRPVRLPVRAGFGRVEESKEHQVARAIVNDCLERGLDSVDISNGNLRVVPSGLLRPLQHLTKLPSIKEAPISEEVYSSLQPFLRLFLAGNALGALSSELFELDNLRVLSLRNNKLTQIPPAIRRLTKLQELNLSVNRLNFLPWELLWLIKKGDLKHLTVRPNPLFQIDESETPIAEWHQCLEEDQGIENLRGIEYEGSAPEEAWAPIHVATSPVSRFDMEGLPIPNTHPLAQSKSRTPSLREASLLSFNKSTYFDSLTEEDFADCPALMHRLLLYARGVRNAGGRSCSVCHRSFVIARTEWIEWWDVSTYENGLKGPRASGERLRPLPFRRLGCSLGCLPSSS
ncbi:hypothetical protein BDV18DRAFT_133235 [Aspergillus unguis]